MPPPPPSSAASAAGLSDGLRKRSGKGDWRLWAVISDGVETLPSKGVCTTAEEAAPAPLRLLCAAAYCWPSSPLVPSEGEGVIEGDEEEEGFWC